MTSPVRSDHSYRCTLPWGAGALAVSIAAAVIAGLLTLVQTAPTDVHPAAPVREISADSASPGSTAEPLHHGVDWRHIDRAPESEGASIAAYER